MTGRLPRSASVAEPREGAKLHAPAAARNADVLADLIAECAPVSGNALEIASGTGQHIVAFAKRCPGLFWHPTEVAADRIASVDAHVAEAELANVAPCRFLDATDTYWNTPPPMDLIVLINLLHLVSDDAAATVISQVAKTLAPGGVFVLYGPFKRAGALTSEGDARFDAELREADPEIGYKDDRWVREKLEHSGLSVETREMPANNLAFIAKLA